MATVDQCAGSSPDRPGALAQHARLGSYRTIAAKPSFVHGYERLVPVAKPPMLDAILGSGRQTTSQTMRFAMNQIRISTSPPSNYDFPKDDCSYYCDLHKTEDWPHLEIVISHKHFSIFPGLNNVRSAMMVTQYMFDDRRKEIGVILEFINEDSELMYYGIDNLGNGRAEPAVNEAAWHMANAGESLAADFRLKRIS